MSDDNFLDVDLKNIATGRRQRVRVVEACPPATTDYDDPMEILLTEKSKEWADIPQGLEVIEEARHEIALYRKYSDYYGYAFFVMKRPME